MPVVKRAGLGNENAVPDLAMALMMNMSPKNSGIGY
jgi:hypothetical protein